MAAGETYFSRFFTKFIEISAAGVATAVSGYVLAHFTGYLNAPQTAALQSPAAVQVPATSPLPSAGPVTVSIAPVATPAPVTSAPAAPAPAASAHAITPQQQQDAKSAPLRKSLPADKSAETANTSDGQARSADAIAAEVRAALAKADAVHPAKTDIKPDIKAEAKAQAKPEIRPDPVPRRPDRPAEVATRTPATDAKPHPAEAPTGAIANIPRPDAPPRAAAITPPLAPSQVAPSQVTPSQVTPPQVAPSQVAPSQVAPQPQPLTQQPLAQPVAQPAPQAPLQIAPPTTTVEIKSMPVAGVDAAQAAPQADTQDAQAQPTDGGLFSVFKHLPEKLRDDKPLPADQAPRPPADVGQ